MERTYGIGSRDDKYKFACVNPRTEANKVEPTEEFRCSFLLTTMTRISAIRLGSNAPT
jgi:hypothetical protein